MARFRVLYLAEEKTEAYRSKAPRKAPNVLTRSHYRDGPEVSGESPYEVWRVLCQNRELAAPDAPKPIDVGDALEADGRLLVCNYWGFDPAQWRGAPSGKAGAKPG